VQGACHNDLASLLSSGFDATQPNHSQSELPAPAILGITNGASTKLTLKVQTVANAACYEVRFSTTPNTWQAGGVYAQARRIVVEGLTPGVVYTLQVRAIGGSTGYSGWSDRSRTCPVRV
jgi:chitodextrinase